MRHLIYILWVLLLTSCGTTYQISTLNYDPIYGPDGTEITVDTIDNEFELARKFRTDDKFRWDFAQFAMKQDLRWNYDFYFNNRMYRSPFASPFDFYWNSHNYWWNWATNSHFNMGFNHWDRFGFYGYGSSFGYYGFNRYGWNGYGSPWNDWGYRQRMNDYAWNNRDRENTAYILGRRGSSNVIVGNRTNIENRIIVNRNKPRIINNNPDVVIDRAIIKLKQNNNNIRVYENPNNVPNKIIIRNNNNSNPVRNYNRPPNNSNNNIIRNNRPSRTYTPPSPPSPPVISRPPTRSSNPPVISRGSGGTRGSVKN